MDSSPTLTIRGPNNEDWASLYTLLNIPAIMLNSFDLPYASEETFRDRMAGNASSHSHMLVAETALPSGRKRVIGVGRIAVQAKRRRHCGQLDLVVHPDYQGSDAACGLLNAVFELADSWLGLRRLQTYVYAEDTAAVAFYTASGFAIEATLRQHALRAGRLSDVLLLARIMPSAAEERAE